MNELTFVTAMKKIYFKRKEYLHTLSLTHTHTHIQQLTNDKKIES